LVIDPLTPAVLYAGDFGGGVYKTTDAGATWTAANSGLSSLFVVALVVDPHTPLTLYVATQDAGVFKSIDGGASWIARNSGLPIDAVGFAMATLAIDPRTPANVYAGTLGFGEGVFRTTDGGSSWSRLNNGLGSLLVSAVAINPSGTCLHAGSFAGVFSFGTRLDSECLPPPPLVAAVLPTSRSVQVEVVATVFASIVTAGFVNTELTTVEAGGIAAHRITCGITQLTGLPTPFTFQATDPTTNQLVGLPNTPVNIPPGLFRAS